MVGALMLNRRHEDDLRVIRGIDRGQLAEFANRLRSHNSAIFSLNELRQLAEGIIPADAADVLIRQVASLAAFARQNNLSADEVMRAVDLGLKYTNWSDDARKEWTSVSKILGEILSAERINVLAKTIDLSHSFDRLLDSVRVLTDIRPVFDEPRANIIGAVITQTLRLGYTADSGDESLSIALDGNMVKTLRDECNRAIAKAQEAKKLMSVKCGIRTVELHEDADDSQ